ncbi:hypothetical protein F0225_10250 [Vibrio pectenicida]|uniref:Uncharacterized protein n=1 Tax=Vibrio pectenicida TaxID=62763 RepID=A0A3R9EIM5_9VIBR|nr:hypothetical protein [Vibrio pectenicida]NOH71715.1 hypothetical protein [Vibrio pectenicida]RSD32337.1 hypothetical protein EJA03_04190 [Vibrio pectenicida]
MSVDNVLKTLFCLTVIATVSNFGLKFRDSPEIMDGKHSLLYYSNNLSFSLDGDVLFSEDYHTVNYRLFFNQKSHTSRKIYGEPKGIYFSYYTQFYDHALIQFSDFTFSDGELDRNSITEIEAHNLRRISEEKLQVIYREGKVVCYTKLLDGGVKCIVRRQ